MSDQPQTVVNNFVPAPTSLGTVITNPAVRAGIYATFVVLLVIVGAIESALLSIHIDFPVWLVATQGALTFLGVPVGGLALANIKKV